MTIDSNMSKTWGGDIFVLNNHTINTSLWDSDGDVFFKLHAINNPKDVCMIDSGETGPSKPGTMMNMSNFLSSFLAGVNIMLQFGLSCNTTLEKYVPQKSTYYYSVILEQTHAHDCHWKVDSCKPDHAFFNSG